MEREKERNKVENGDDGDGGGGGARTSEGLRPLMPLRGPAVTFSPAPFQLRLKAARPVPVASLPFKLKVQTHEAFRACVRLPPSPTNTHIVTNTRGSAQAEADIKGLALVLATDGPSL